MPYRTFPSDVRPSSLTSLCVPYLNFPVWSGHEDVDADHIVHGVTWLAAGGAAEVDPGGGLRGGEGRGFGCIRRICRVWIL